MTYAGTAGAGMTYAGTAGAGMTDAGTAGAGMADAGTAGARMAGGGRRPGSSLIGPYKPGLRRLKRPDSVSASRAPSGRAGPLQAADSVKLWRRPGAGKPLRGPS
eukprot:747099-Hanusia_phi.AAC.2